MTLQQRAEAFAAVYAKWPASHLRIVREQQRDVLYGRWLIGQDYRNKTTYYGAYPKSYLERVMVLFPEAEASRTLHVFSGSLPVGDYVRCDIAQPSELQYSVYDLPEHVGGPTFDLILADPAYSAADSLRYETKMINRRLATAALAAVARPGAHMVWLDVCWPQHRKAEWVTVGRITLLRSTNHRVREITIFQRQTP